MQTATFINRANLPAGTQQRLALSAEGAPLLTSVFAHHIDTHELEASGGLKLLKREAHRILETRGGVTPADVRGIAQREHQSGTVVQTRHDEVALNPQPLPPHEESALNPVLARGITLPGLKSLTTLPGFAQAPIALATMMDGAVLVLGLEEDGSPRVAGSFSGPIGALDVAGNWALASDTKRLSLFHLTRVGVQPNRG